MGGDEGWVRRRTSFEKDIRELLLKVVLGAVAGFALYLFSGWEGSVWVPLVVGWVAVFYLAHLIRGDSRHAD